MSDLIEPSDIERGGLPDCSREYMAGLEEEATTLRSQVERLQKELAKSQRVVVNFDPAATKEVMKQLRQDSQRLREALERVQQCPLIDDCQPCKEVVDAALSSQQPEGTGKPSTLSQQEDGKDAL